jgi:hypothetical protein
MKKTFVATACITLMLSSLTIFGQSQSREDLLKEIAAKRAELSKLEKVFLAPSEEDRAKYADFLRQPDTGLMRLLPREIFDTGSSRKDAIPMTIRGGGAYYSFKEQTHEYGNSSALSLEQGQFSTGFAGADYGMLANLGDVPLENVSLETTAAQILAQHTPAADEPHARIEQRKSSEGTTIDGITYKGRVSMQLNSTYVLRSVTYHASDSLVAFRVVRVESDDSVIILWKLLKKYPTPYLARN